MNALLTRFFARKEKEYPAPLSMHLGLKKRLETRAPIRDAEFTAFDTELTGLDFREDSIISIGAVKMKGGSIMPGRSFYRLVKPDSRLKSESILVHGITHSELHGADAAAEALAEFIEFIGDSVLVGHFAYIDVNFIGKAMKEAYGTSLQSPVLDTMAIHDWLYENDSRFARHYNGMTLRKDLYSMARRYGIPVEETHNALQDAYITAQLFQRFINFLPGCGVRTLGELLSVGKT